jgi:GxxExxY protein
MELLHKDLSEKIIKCYYKVYNTLGYGFLEKVYENALAIELTKSGLNIQKQQPISVYYDGELVGEYFSDIIVNDIVIIELKASAILKEENEAQLLNYLRATKIELGFLFNFGTEAEYKRKIYMNKYKHKNQ